MDQTHGTAPGGDYNDMFHSSMPYQQSRPAHVCAAARMFGLPLVPSERGRVLEIGCASAGNIIRLAQLDPVATFLGVDLTPRQVADGKARFAALGMTNLDSIQEEIGTLDLSGNIFD